MKVISGKAKGKRLLAPKGLSTRPITAKIKEALFNILGNRVIGSNFLDLFAGSGSVGIEALSRGANKVVFVDKSREAIAILRKNLTNCLFNDGFELHCNDVLRALSILNRHKIKFNIIYVDPPFTNDKIFLEVINFLDKVDILESEGILIIRTPKKKELPTELNNLFKYRLDNYGESNLHYYRLLKEGILG